MLERFRAASLAIIGRAVMKATGVGIRLMPTRLAATWTDIAFPSLVKHGYKGSAAVWACVRVWATTFCEPEMRVRRRTDSGREWLHDHPTSLLIQRPNPWMGEDMFWQFVITYTAIGGNCYVWKERSRSGQVIGLWPMHDGHVSPVPDPEGWLSHYRYDMGDGSAPTPIPASDIIHLLWAPDPSSPIRGIGPLVAAARAVDMGNEAQRYVYAYLKNDAAPRTLLNLKEPVGQKLADIKKRFVEQYGGENRGGLMVVDEGEATVTRIGANLSELAVESLWNMPEAWITAAFEVPAIKAGLSIGLQRGYSGANADALNSDFAVSRLVPRWRMVAGQFTRSLLAEMDPDPALALEFDTSTVQALREDENELRASINSAVTAGWMTVNEARARAGLERGDGGDVFLRSMAALEQPTGGEPGKTELPALTGPVSDLTSGADPAAIQVSTGESAAPTTSLNGAQVSSLLSLIQSIGDGPGQLPRDTVTQLIVTAFALPLARVKEMLAAIPMGGIPQPEAAAKAEGRVSRAEIAAARKRDQKRRDEMADEMAAEIADELARMADAVVEAVGAD